MSSRAQRSGNVLGPAHRGKSERGRNIMAEVSWLSDYVSGNDRSADRFGLASNQGLGQGAPSSIRSNGFGAQGIAGLLGIGTEHAAQSWQEQALCAETAPEAFFPDKGGWFRDYKKASSPC